MVASVSAKPVSSRPQGTHLPHTLTRSLMKFIIKAAAAQIEGHNFLPDKRSMSEEIDAKVHR